MTDNDHKEELIAALAHDYKQELAECSLDDLRAHAALTAQMKNLPADWWREVARELPTMKEYACCPSGSMKFREGVGEC